MSELDLSAPSVPAAPTALAFGFDRITWLDPSTSAT